MILASPPQVALRELQMRGMPSDLLPGEPLCSPRATVLLEATVQLLRRLHPCPPWTPHLNQHMQARLELIGPLMRDARPGCAKQGLPNTPMC